MALITCPECGKEISDKSSRCIYCGSPITFDQTIKIKIPKFVTGMLNQNASKAEVYINGNIIWSGYSGQVAEFKTNEQAHVSVKIIKAYTGHPFPFFKNFEIIGEVEPGKRYEIKKAKTSLVFGDPTKSEYVFSNVDVIDSGL